MNQDMNEDMIKPCLDWHVLIHALIQSRHVKSSHVLIYVLIRIHVLIPFFPNQDMLNQDMNQAMIKTCLDSCLDHALIMS